MSYPYVCPTMSETPGLEKLTRSPSAGRHRRCHGAPHSTSMVADFTRLTFQNPGSTKGQSCVPLMTSESVSLREKKECLIAIMSTFPSPDAAETSFFEFLVKKYP